MSPTTTFQADSDGHRDSILKVKVADAYAFFESNPQRRKGFRHPGASVASAKVLSSGYPWMCCSMRIKCYKAIAKMLGRLVINEKRIRPRSPGIRCR